MPGAGPRTKVEVRDIWFALHTEIHTEINSKAYKKFKKFI